MIIWCVIFHFKTGDSIDLYESKEAMFQVLEHMGWDPSRVVFEKSLPPYDKWDDRDYYCYYPDGKGNILFHGELKCVFQEH